ncbi:MAG: hypothetical protein JNL52_07220 [Flavobacteriales bacterium]|nr:hypothetical protein [Flavobacteriales bacterium]
MVDQSPVISTSLRYYRNQRLVYWERRRIIFLGLLLIPTALVLLSSEVIGAAVADMSSDLLAILFYLLVGFVGANACYSVVYIPEFLLMGTSWMRYWDRARVWIFISGCAIGFVFTLLHCKDAIWLIQPSSGAF